MDYLRNIYNWILDLIFPKECFGCGLDKTYLCYQCQKQIKVHNNLFCIFCKQTMQWGQICPHCQKTALKAVFVVSDYNNKLIELLIQNYKYRYVEELSLVLVALILKYIKENEICHNYGFSFQNTIITAVSLHQKRYLSRGFNQSQLMAEKLAQNLGFEYHDLLIRKINTPSQVNLKKEERQQNVANAFIFNNKFDGLNKNKKIIIIDDVVTTGSTLEACAQELERQGFMDIYGLVIAQRD